MHENMKVLFATDFSPSAKLALHTAQTFAEVYQAKIQLIHVLESFWKNYFAHGSYEKEALRRLTTWQQCIYPNNEPASHLTVQVGNAADRILQQVRVSNPDLLLLGGESQGSKDTFITGTTAENIVRHCRTSVWLTKKNALKKVLCGIDGSIASSKALKEAIALCHRFQATLSIVYALPAADFNPLGMDEKSVSAKENEFKTEKTNAIKTFLEDFDYGDLEVDQQVLWGVPSNVMLNLAEDFDYDVIVIGATGESMLKQVIIGSTAEKILRKTPCSLFIVR